MAILALMSVSLNETANLSEPIEEEATFVERREGLPIPLVIFAVIGAIAGVTIFVLRKKKLIF